jgi:biopolymer transport protein ExbD
VRLPGDPVAIRYSAAVALALICSASLAEVPASQEVSITIQADGAHCDVQKVKILCTDVVAYLRDVLKLPARSRVRLRAGRAVPHEPVKKVIDMLSKSDYPLPVAYLTEPKSLGK